jgi:hypothetical protein
VVPRSIREPRDKDSCPSIFLPLIGDGLRGGDLKRAAPGKVLSRESGVSNAGPVAVDGETRGRTDRPGVSQPLARGADRGSRCVGGAQVDPGLLGQESGTLPSALERLWAIAATLSKAQDDGRAAQCVAAIGPKGAATAVNGATEGEHRGGTAFR